MVRKSVVPKSAHGPQSGSLLIFAFFLMAMLAVIPTVFQVLSTSRRNTQNVISKQRVGEIAVVGLESTLAWFRRQTTQPVGSLQFPLGTYTYPDAAFNPIVDADPLSPTAQGGTMDAAIGMVEEFELNAEKKIWARYEVRRQKDPGSNPIDVHAAHDITELRFPGAPPGSGWAWGLSSRGIAYLRNNPGVPYDVSPNRVIDTQYAYSEIRRLSIQALAPCALLIPSVANPTALSLDLLTTINGGAEPGILTFNDAGFDSQGASVSGTPALRLTGAFPLDPESMFQASLSDLHAVSDMVIDTSEDSEFALLGRKEKSLVVDDILVYLKSSGSDYTLKLMRDSSGILLVSGSITLEGYYDGLILVDGNVRLRGFSVNGCLVVTGTLQVLPMASNGQLSINAVVYDPDALRKAFRCGGRYRKTKTMIAGIPA